MNDPRITDEMVAAAERAWNAAYWTTASPGRLDWMRAALEAALPHPAPQSADRDAVRALMVDALNAYVNLGPQGYYVYVDSLMAVLNGGAK